ncbi:MAG: alpha/beta fold hydrolase, partial [Rhizobiales bacterium]|nr:alpha/beta fold hydrolase [Rhizobacter sp.]
MELVVNSPNEGVPADAPAYAYTGGKPFNAALPCIVFVHGALNDHSVWTLLARWFAHHGHGVLAVDLPGHGRSRGLPLQNVEALADWLLAVLDAAGVERV